MRDTIETTETCPNCGGSGETLPAQGTVLIISEICTQCNGSGIIIVNKPVIKMITDNDPESLWGTRQ